ncbi:MAG TPA: hypothetical protein VFT89_04445, partial [Rhizobiaceae bacterium]|nr:hypothetical protein [Rhizobiaceae bacterium]
MYDRSDPRSQLAATPKAAAPAAFAAADYGLFYEIEPQIRDGGTKTWLTRGQNFMVGYSEVEAGGVLERKNQP